MSFFRATIDLFALLAGSITQSAAQDGPFHEGIGSAPYHKSVKKALQAAGLGGHVIKGNSEEADGFVRNREKIEALRLDSFAGGRIE